jgi:hypothetical protein
MNPGAGTSNPYDSQAESTMNETKVMNGSSVATSNGHVEDGAVTVDAVVDQLRRAMIDELCALHCDVDILKRGGWKLALGPFVQQTPVTEADRQQFYETIAERVQGKTGLELTTPSAIVSNGMKKTLQADSLGYVCGPMR